MFILTSHQTCSSFCHYLLPFLLLQSLTFVSLIIFLHCSLCHIQQYTSCREGLLCYIVSAWMLQLNLFNSLHGLPFTDLGWESSYNFPVLVHNDILWTLIYLPFHSFYWSCHWCINQTYHLIAQTTPIQTSNIPNPPLLTPIPFQPTRE